MKVKMHIVSSLPLGIGYYLISKDLFATFLAMVSTVFMDTDHILDYIITQRRIDSLNKILKAFDAFAVPKNYFLLHSWELMILLACILSFYPNPYLIAVLAGCVYHLFLDQVYNTLLLGRYNLKMLAYFFTYRMILNFDVRSLRRKGVIK